MHQKVRLFIGGRELEFSQEPAILYQFSMDDIQNPTAVRNSYTKTVQVEGTQRNNQIFNDIWDLTRTQPTDGDMENYFNPSKRTDFSLYVDGDLYETGYVKLDAINRKHNGIVYNITLYGGVGDFLYSITYSDTGEKKKLRDLNYIVKGNVSGDPVSELDFNITWDTVRNAWWRIGVGTMYGDERWDVVNFMPCYNGYPDSLDADKVLFNLSGFTSDVRMRSGTTTTTISGFPSTLTVSGTTYSPVNGYGFGELNGKMTEWEMRDLRSYLQRPVLKFKKVMEAICDPTQNGGYNVVLDTDFFNSGNTYYENAWITLPLLSDLNFEEETSENWGVEVSSTTTYNGMHNTRYTLKDVTARGNGTTALEVTFRPMLSVRDSVYPRDPATANTLYTSAYISGSNSRIDYGSFVYQLVGADSNGNIVCGSDIFNLTSEVNGSYLNLTDTLYQTSYAGASIQNRLGAFSKVSAGTYQWGEDITLRMTTNNSKVVNVYLYATMMANLTQGTTSRGEVYNTYGFRQDKLYTSTSLTESNYSASTKGSSWIKPTLSGTAYYGSGTKINSGARVTKQVLLNLDGTPCDYLLGYMKTFGLYLKKDPIRKTVSILTRNNYYNSGSNVIDIEDRIDHTKNIKVTPLTFKHKWYSFNYTQGDKSAFEDKYYTKWGSDYGVQKVNTGYNFDSETEDLLKGIAYNNAAEGLEKSPYFYDRSVGGNLNYPTPLFSWVKYKLLNGDDSAEVDIASPLNFTDIQLGSFGDMYDIFPKVQFRDTKKDPIEGSGVFVFYNGYKECKDANGNSITYWVTDDLPEMYTFNDNPCWLWTNHHMNKAGQQIGWYFSSLPSFGRYQYTDNGAYIAYAWDFGKVKELFVPYVYYNENANIYDRYWSRYVNDLYDVNTRICEAYVKLPKTQGDKLMRQMYWFDNSIWRINKIVDWNVCSDDTTKVEFVKVQDVRDYTDNVDPIIPTAESFTCTVSMSPDPIPASGGVVTFTVNSNQSWGGNGPWYDWIEFSNNYWNGRNASGTTTFTATAQTNQNSLMRSFDIMLVGAYDERKIFGFDQDPGQGIQCVVNQPVGGLSLPASGGTINVTVYSETPWTATTTYNYTTLTQDTGTNGTAMIATVSANDSPSWRQNEFHIVNQGGQSTTLYISQNGTA